MTTTEKPTSPWVVPPCQSFSVAGKRLGMDDPRATSPLSFYVVEAVQPKWFIFENVALPLIVRRRKRFQVLLYGGGTWVWTSTESLTLSGSSAQRRRRAFVVGSADGDWRSAASVLFESNLAWGNPKTSKEAREDDSTTIGRGFDEAAFGEDGFGGMTVSMEMLLKLSEQHMGFTWIVAAAHHEDGEKVSVWESPNRFTDYTSSDNWAQQLLLVMERVEGMFLWWSTTSSMALITFQKIPRPRTMMKRLIRLVWIWQRRGMIPLERCVREL